VRVARRSWQEYYKGESTTEWKLRGTALDDAIKKAAPSAAMELGTYCGYSAVRIGRLLPPGGKLVSVEVDPLYAAIATKVRRPALSAPRLATALLRVRSRRTPGRWSSTRGWATASRSRSATLRRSSTASRPSTAWAPRHVGRRRLGGGATAHCPGASWSWFLRQLAALACWCEPLAVQGPMAGRLPCGLTWG
jgi:hypothetical protein